MRVDKIILKNCHYVLLTFRLNTSSYYIEARTRTWVSGENIEFSIVPRVIELQRILTS